MVHIVYCDKKNDELSKIINGNKTMIIKSSFSRRIPHSRVFISDTLYFIEKGSNSITVKAKVRDVQNYVKLSNDDVNKIIVENESKLNIEENKRDKYYKKCVCLIEFYDVEKIDPINFEHSNNLEDWLIYEDIKDVK